MKKVIFWAVYLVAVAAAWSTTYQVFIQSDSQFVAALAATSVDGVLAYTLYVLGQAAGNQKTAAIASMAAFALVSGVAQIIHRFYALGVQMPYELQVVSLFLVPISTTGAVVVLGIIKYFETPARFGSKQNQTQNRPNFQESHQQSHQPQIQRTPNLEPAHSNGNGMKEWGESLPTIGELRRTDGQPFPTKPRS